LQATATKITLRINQSQIEILTNIHIERFWTRNWPSNGNWTFFQHRMLTGRDNLPNKVRRRCRHSRCACKESLKLDYSANQVVPWPWYATIISILTKLFFDLARHGTSRSSTIPPQSLFPHKRTN